MENIIGLITYGRGEFGVLAAHRPAYMLPFGCRYRLIDFALSTFSNNDIDNVALYAGSMLRSTIDHIGNGKPWDLNRRFGGLSIFPEVYSSKYNRSDELVNIYESLGFYESAVEEQIFFMDPMTITKIDVREVYRQHLTEDADMTLIYKTVDDKEGRYLNYDKMTLNDDGTVKNIGVNLGTQDVFNLYLGMGFIKKSVFLDLIKNALDNDKIMIPYNGGSSNVLSSAFWAGIRIKCALSICTIFFSASSGARDRLRVMARTASIPIESFSGRIRIRSGCVPAAIFIQAGHDLHGTLSLQNRRAANASTTARACSVSIDSKR
jgi:hypothetical protein